MELLRWLSLLTVSWDFMKEIVFMTILLAYSLYYVTPLLHQVYNFLSNRTIKGNKNSILETEEQSTRTVTLIKPVTSHSLDVLSNFHCYFRQKYKNYQIIFCFSDSGNPLIEQVKKLMLRYSNVDCDIKVMDSACNSNLKGNKKIMNIMQALPFAKGEILWIADENIQVSKNAIASCVKQLQAGYSLVHMMPYWKRQHGLIDLVTFTFFNTLHARFYDFGNITRFPSMSGMSFFIHAEDLAEVGGFLELKNHVAEDSILCRLIRNRNKAFTISFYPAIQNNKNNNLRTLVKRLSRWHQIRIHFSPFSYIEFILFPLVTVFIVCSAYCSTFHNGRIYWMYFPGALVTLEFIYHFLGLRISKSRFSFKDLGLFIPSWLIMHGVAVSALLLAIWNKNIITWINTKYTVTNNTLIIEQEST